MSHKKKERFLGLAALVAIIIVWLTGAFIEDKEISSYLRKAMPLANRFESGVNGHFTAYHNQQIIGYLNISQAMGYGGPIKIATAVNFEGKVTGIAVIEQKETVSYFEKVIINQLFEKLLNKTVSDRFVIGADVDVISGATYSSKAVVTAVSKSAHSIGKENLKLQVPITFPPGIKFSLPEITLLFLFIIGFVGRRKKVKYGKQIRWVSLLTGLVVLGFIYNSPLTIAKLTGLLLGFVPVWQLLPWLFSFLSLTYGYIL